MSDSVQAATSDLEPSSGAIAPQRLSRPSVAEMDLILGQSFKVLDDGFIRVIDYMGAMPRSSRLPGSRMAKGPGG